MNFAHMRGVSPSIALRLLAGLAFCWLQFAAAEDSTERVGYFDLPSQPLQSGVVEFALQADITIVADHKLLEGQVSSPIVGPKKLDHALRTMLSNTELAYYYVEQNDAFVLFQRPRNESEKESPGPKVSLPPPNLDEVLVLGNVYPARYTTIANSQLHSGVSYYDSARFLNLLPRKLIEDQQPDDLGELVSYASGVTIGDGLSDTNDDVYIRGFQRHATYIDGFRLGEWTGTKQHPAMIEQVEILKGPSTLRYGQAEPGGIVNIVRKKPISKSFLQAQLEGGSFGHRELAIDANTALPGMKEAWLRLVVADEVQDEARDVRDVHRQLVNVSTAIQLSSDTAIDLGFERSSTELTSNRDYPVFRAYEDVFAGATLAQVANQATENFEAEADFFNAELNHYLTPNWRLQGSYFWHDEQRVGVRNSAEAMLETDLFFEPGEWGVDYLALIPGGQTVFPIILDTSQQEIVYSIGAIRNIYHEEAWDTANNLKLMLEGSFDLASTEHRVSIGGDWHGQEVFRRYTIEERDLYPFQSWTETEFSLVLPTVLVNDLFNPDRALGNLNIEERYLNYNDYGFYVRDNIEFTDRFILSLGTRISSINGEHTNFNQNVITELISYNRLSSQLGLVYKATDGFSIYANYSEALRANYHIDEIGSARAEPELSDQIELGFKSIFFDGKLTSSFALYNINKENIVELAIVDGIRSEVQATEKTVSGIDLDLSWQANKKIDVIAAASLMDAEFSSGPYQGFMPPMVPEQSASVFVNYQHADNLSVNLGAKYVGERFADNTNRFYIDWYSRIDFGLEYRMDYLEVAPLLRVSVNNLSDTDYYTAIVSGVRENYAEGRTVDLSLSVEF